MKVKEKTSIKQEYNSEFDNPNNWNDDEAVSESHIDYINGDYSICNSKNEIKELVESLRSNV